MPCPEPCDHMTCDVERETGLIATYCVACQEMVPCDCESPPDRDYDDGACATHYYDDGDGDSGDLLPFTGYVGPVP